MGIPLSGCMFKSSWPRSCSENHISFIRFWYKVESICLVPARLRVPGGAKTLCCQRPERHRNIQKNWDFAYWSVHSFSSERCLRKSRYLAIKLQTSALINRRLCSSMFSSILIFQCSKSSCQNPINIETALLSADTPSNQNDFIPSDRSANQYYWGGSFWFLTSSLTDLRRLALLNIVYIS